MNRLVETSKEEKRRGVAFMMPLRGWDISERETELGGR